MNEQENGDQKRLKTKVVQPDLQVASTVTNQADRVIGFNSESYRDSYQSLQTSIDGTNRKKQLLDSEAGSV